MFIMIFAVFMVERIPRNEFAHLCETFVVAYGTNYWLFALRINTNGWFLLVIQFRIAIHIWIHIYTYVCNICPWYNPKKWFSTSSYGNYVPMCKILLIILIRNEYKWICSWIIPFEMWIYSHMHVCNYIGNISSSNNHKKWFAPSSWVICIHTVSYTHLTLPTTPYV